MRRKLIVGAVATVFQLTAALTGHVQNSNAGQSNVYDVSAEGFFGVRDFQSGQNRFEQAVQSCPLRLPILLSPPRLLQ